MINQKFMKYCYKLLISTSIFFAGCPVETNTGNSDVREKTRPKDRQTSSFSTTEITLDGEPCGGELDIFVFNTSVRIQTSPKDSINKVAAKIVNSINSNISLQKQGIKGETEDSKLILTNVQEYDVYICTTDKGINIPEKPMNLVCNVEGGHFIVFRWKNPNGFYDRIHIVESGIPIAEGLPGTSTSFKYDYLSPHGNIYEGKHIYRVTGVKRGTPVPVEFP